MRRAKWVAFLIILALMLPLLPACEEEEEDEPTVDEWIARGKKLLGEGDGTGAYLAFQEALEQDDDNLQARYGVVLADVLQFTGTIELLLGLLIGEEETIPADETAALCQRLQECGVLGDASMTYEECVAGGTFGLDADTRACVIEAPNCQVVYDRCLGLMLPPGEELCADACAKMEDCGLLGNTAWSAADCREACPDLYVSGQLDCFLMFEDCAVGREACFPVYGDTVQSILGEFWTQISAEMANNLAMVQAKPQDFRFDIENFNFTFFDIFFNFSFAGVHDYSDSWFFSAAYSGIEALFTGAMGLDLNFNPILLESLDLDLDLNIDFEDFDNEDKQKILDLIDWVDHLLELILNDPVYFTFLSVKEPDGVDAVIHTGQMIGWIFGSLAEIVDSVERETDEQEDDVIRYVDENANLLWDDPEPLIVPGVLQMEYGLAWAVRDLLVALKVDFVDGYPFHFENLSPLFDYFDLSFVSAIIEVLDLVGLDYVDLGEPFRYPDPAGLRPFLFDLQEFLVITKSVFAEIEF
ncbi:MAG: hypothetical protein ACTSXZ_00090 [Alphaproteobacteria bacterium]